MPLENWSSPQPASETDPVIRYSIDEILTLIFQNDTDSRVEILAPLVRGKKGEFRNLFSQTREKGYTRVRVDGAVL